MDWVCARCCPSSEREEIEIASSEPTPERVDEVTTKAPGRAHRQSLKIGEMHQGPLVKYQLGSGLKVTRWAKLTRTRFILFKSQYSEAFAEKPLKVIPTYAIHALKAFPDESKLFFEVLLGDSGASSSYQESSGMITPVMFEPPQPPLTPKKRVAHRSKTLNESSWTAREKFMAMNSQRLIVGTKTPRDLAVWKAAFLQLCNASFYA